MKPSRFTQTFTLLTAFQLALAPVASADTSLASTILNMGAQLAAQAQMSQYGMMCQQAVQSMDVRPCGPGQHCASQVFPECRVLQTLPNIVVHESCTGDFDMSNPMEAAARAQCAHQMATQFDLMNNAYEVMSVEDNQGSNEGIGCLTRSAAALERALLNREQQIDNLINQLKSATDAFKRAAAADRQQVEMAQALLKGPNNATSRQALAQQNVQFANLFADAGCRMVMNANDFNNKGNAGNGNGGLEAIQTELSNRANAKAPGAGNFSAAEWNSGTASAVEKDVRNLAQRMANQTRSGGPQALTSLNSSGSTYGFNREREPLASVLGTFASETETSLAEFRNKVDDLGAVESGRPAPPNLFGNPRTFASELANWERSYKNACLSGQPNIRALGGDLRIINQNATIDADSAYVTFIRDTLANNGLSIEEKLRRIREFESTGSNSNYVVDTQRSATVGNTSVKASTRMTPAAFIQLHVQNCQQQFESNANSQGVTPASLSSQLKSIHSQYQAFTSSLGTNLANRIINQVIDCADNRTANAQGVATCSSQDLSTGSANFCVKRATSCANGMNGCFAKAQTLVQTETQKRNQAAQRYNASVENHKRNLMAMYRNAQQHFAIQGVAISQTLQQGLVLPTDVKFDYAEGERARAFLDGLQDMSMEDPDKFFDLVVKKNLDELKEQLRAQRIAVMTGNRPGERNSGEQSGASGGVNGHIRQIRENVRLAQQRIREAQQTCTNNISNYNQAYGAYRQMMQERMEAQQRACAAQQAISHNPSCDIADLAESSFQSAAEAGNSSAMAYMGQFQSICRTYNSEVEDVSDVDRLLARGGGDEPSSVREFCSLRENANHDGCQAWRVCFQDGDEMEREQQVAALRRAGARALNCGTSADAAACQQSITTACQDDDVEEYIAEEFREEIANRRESALIAMRSQASGLGENRGNGCGAEFNSFSGGDAGALQMIEGLLGSARGQ